MRAFLFIVLVCLALPARSETGPVNSTTPPCIRLVGSTGGVPAAAAGSFQVIFRDLANNPIVGGNIVIDFSGAPDLVICADQLDPGVVVNCAAKTVSRLSDANGGAAFTILGGSNGAGHAVTLLNGGKIFGNGTLLGFPTVSAFDLDGSGGVGANDLAAWLGDFFTAQSFGRSDYDCSGTVGANDFSQWLGVYGSGMMANSCGASCP
jgi:hypothetical protein